jgi:uncharacterized coiled-coil DUF342 family protein
VSAGNVADEKVSLNKLVTESKNPDAERIKKEIDAIRDQKAKLIGKSNEYRRRLAYKEREIVTIEKLLKAEAEKGDDPSKEGRIGYLKRMKSRLEFKISTEASSLSKEKALVRQIDEISKQLDEALARVRLKRKEELVRKDIEEYRSGITATSNEMAETELKLDRAYSELRKVLGIGIWQNKQKQHKKRELPPKPQEINLEDIVVIKKKEVKHGA